MSEGLFQRPIVPVASPEDATATAAALAPHVDATSGTVVAVHVIEKAGGAPDKASVEQREEHAHDIFDQLLAGIDAGSFAIETHIVYGTDVAETIIDAAHDHDASAIVFTPRGGSRWQKLLTGDVTTALVNGSDIPVVVLPDEPAADEETGEQQATDDRT